jgi:hypothetical protein
VIVISAASSTVKTPTYLPPNRDRVSARRVEIARRQQELAESLVGGCAYVGVTLAERSRVRSANQCTRPAVTVIDDAIDRGS